MNIEWIHYVLVVYPMYKNIILMKENHLHRETRSEWEMERHRFLFSIHFTTTGYMVRYLYAFIKRENFQENEANILHHKVSVVEC